MQQAMSNLPIDQATYAKVSLVPSTRSMYSFSSNVSIAYNACELVANGETGRAYLFNIWDLGRKPLRDLGDDFLDQRLILHGLFMKKISLSVHMKMEP